jgi:aminoglycoside 6'-N-acetyltransferase
LQANVPRRTTSPPVLRGERVVLRPAGESDVLPLVAVLADPEVALWWGPHDAQRVRDDLNHEGSEILVVELEGEVIGLVEVTEESEPDYRHVALDIAIRADLHGRGLGGESLRAVIEYLIDERGHHRFTIDPAVENERAIRSYTRLGFRPVGVMRRSERAPDGTWRDGLLMDLLAEELPR